MYKKFQYNIFTNENRMSLRHSGLRHCFEANGPGTDLSNACFFNT